MRPYSSLFSQKLLQKNNQTSFPYVLGKGGKKVILEDAGNLRLTDCGDFKRVERWNFIRKPFRGPPRG